MDTSVGPWVGDMLTTWHSMTAPVTSLVAFEDCGVDGFVGANGCVAVGCAGAADASEGVGGTAAVASPALPGVGDA